MAVNDFYWELNTKNPDAIVYAEFEHAYLGIVQNPYSKPVACYDYWTMVGIIAEDFAVDRQIMYEVEERMAVKGKTGRPLPASEERINEELWRMATEYIEHNIISKNDGGENAPMYVYAPEFDEREQEK